MTVTSGFSRRLLAHGRARRQFLARPGLARDQHRGVGVRDLGDVAQDLPERRAVADQRAVLLERLQLLPQPFRFHGERPDFPLRFETLVHVAENQRREPPAVQLEAGKRGFGGKGFAFGAAGGQAAGNPARLLAFGAGVEFGDERDQPGGVLPADESPEILPGHLARRAAEDPLRGRVDLGDVEPVVQFDDRVHGAAEKASDLFLPLAHLRLGAQPPELGCRPRGEDLKDGMHGRLLGNRPPVDDGHVPQNVPVRVLQGDTHVADGPGRFQLFFVGIDFQHPVGKMHQLGRVDDALAGRPGDVDFVVQDPLAVHPEGQGAEASPFRKIFRHPGAVRAERLGEILHQRGKKPLAGFRGGALKNRAQGRIRFQPLKGLRSIGRRSAHGRKVWGEAAGRCKRRGDVPYAFREVQCFGEGGS